MARYHFHVSDGGDYPDPVGTELRSVEDARKQALKSASEMLSEAVNGGVFGKDWVMSVADQTGLLLFRLEFQLTESPAVKLAPASQ